MKKHAFQALEKTYGMNKVSVILSKVFDYDDFRKKFGARLVEASGVTSCPYCDHAFINQYNSKLEKTTAELDHFFPKSIYPFWAVSPWNIIPACHSCNALMKKAGNPVVEPLLYPYQTKGSEIHFSQKFSKNGYMYDQPTHFNITIDTNTRTAKNSVNLFHLNELYQSHKEYVANIVRLKRIQTYLMCKENARLLKMDFCNVVATLDTFFESMKHQRILSKLTNDILNTLDKLMANE